MRILADRNRAGFYVAIAVAFCAMFAAFLFLTYYLQQNLGYSPMKTGAAFLPLSAGIGDVGTAALSTIFVSALKRFSPTTRPLAPRCRPRRESTATPSPFRSAADSSSLER